MVEREGGRLLIIMIKPPCTHAVQWRGVRFGLAREGRMLLADEPGVGKSLQAMAMAVCYSEEWPLLIVCPANL